MIDIQTEARKQILTGAYALLEEYRAIMNHLPVPEEEGSRQKQLNRIKREVSYLSYRIVVNDAGDFDLAFGKG